MHVRPPQRRTPEPQFIDSGGGNILEEMRAEHDPIAVYIFIARRQHRNTHDTKGGKAKDRCAMLSWQRACELGFRGTLGEWERLMGATAKR